MGQSASSNANTTDLREDPTQWLWIPLLGIVFLIPILLYLVLYPVAVCVVELHAHPASCGIILFLIAVSVCYACAWLIKHRARIRPFLCEVGYSIAEFIGRIIRFFSRLVFVILGLCTALTFILWLLSGVAYLFSSFDSFMEAPIGTKVGAELGLLPSLWFPLFVLLIVLGIACYVANRVDDKLNPAKDSQPQR